MGRKRICMHLPGTLKRLFKLKEATWNTNNSSDSLKGKFCNKFHCRHSFLFKTLHLHWFTCGSRRILNDHFWWSFHIFQPHSEHLLQIYNDLLWKWLQQGYCFICKNAECEASIYKLAISTNLLLFKVIKDFCTLLYTNIHTYVHYSSGHLNRNQRTQYKL